MSTRVYSETVCGLQVQAVQHDVFVNGVLVEREQVRALRRALKRADQIARSPLSQLDCIHEWTESVEFGHTDVICSDCGKDASKEEREQYFAEKART